MTRAERAAVKRVKTALVPVRGAETRWTRDLGAVQWTQHVLQRLVDALDMGGVTAEWLAANGLRAP
jgi:hypothetical protein